MDKKYTCTKYACYTTSMTMSIVSNFTPLLFLTFRDLYDISYSLLGLLVLINFTTQLTIDLIFSFFSHRFNIPLTVKLIPVIAVVGMMIYALSPFIFPGMVYLGIVIATIIISASSGLAEVLISPVIAAIPAKDPEHEMSKLHSMYAWGVVGVVIVSTVFLLVFGHENWQWLAAIFTLVPLTSAILYAGAEIPEMQTPEKATGAMQYLRNPVLWVYFAAIFVCGAAECTMGQWASSYLEQALGIPKVFGDIFGVALFSAMLGLGRSGYAKFGKNIRRVLLLGAIGSAVCYFVAAISPFAVIGLIACALCGFCASMLWPGMLIIAPERFPNGGVFIYAIMAAGGDLGASVVPQLVGIITDVALTNPTFMDLAQTFDLAPERFGMKLGLLVGMLFPLCGIPLFVRFVKESNKKKMEPI